MLVLGEDFWGLFWFMKGLKACNVGIVKEGNQFELVGPTVLAYGTVPSHC